MNATSNTIAGPEYNGGVDIFRGLIWRHWLAGRWVIIAALFAVLTGGWALMLFHHPGWIITTGSMLAVIAGLVFGGSDVSDGSEEFAFALPPTRSQRYLSGLVLGGGTVLAYCLIGTLTIAFSLPQYAWSLVVDSGFTAPFGPWPETYLYFMAVVVPLSVFALTFTIESLARTRGGMWWSWIPALIITGLTVMWTTLAETEMWGDVNGYISILTLLSMTAMTLLFGHNRYACKEGVSRPGRSGADGSGLWWIWVIVAAIIALVILSLILWTSHAPSKHHEEVATRAPQRHTHSVETVPIPDTASPEQARAIDKVAQSRAEDQALEDEIARMQAPNTNAIRQARQERQQVTGQITLVAPGIVVLVVLFVAIFIVPRKRSARTIRLRGPRRRHIVTRSVCAVLALAIITSVGYFSWTEAGATYAVESPQTGTVQIRTKIPVDLTAELKPNQQVTLKKGRLLIKAMVLEAVTATSFRTIRTDEFDINWIDGNSDIIENSFKLEDSAIHYRLNLTNVYLRQREGAAHNALQIEGHWMTAVSRPNGGRSSSSTGGRIIRNGIGGITNINSGNRYRSNKPLSAIPSSAAYGRLILCLFADIAEPDDKLATISTEQFITDSHEQMLAQNNQNHGGFNRRWRVDPHVPPMVSLIEHAGIAGALLAVAAVLMAQLFMRRRLATTIMLAVVILYIAAIDRAALDMHISHAQDPDAPISKRLAACSAASDTFFYANTAAAQLRTIANDKQAPELLKYRSARNARLLSAIASIPTEPLKQSRIWSKSTAQELPMGNEERHDYPQWEVHTFYRRPDHTPLMVVIRMPPRHSGHDQLDDSIMLWRIIALQADPTGKIAILAPSLKATVIGEESDMLQAAWAIQDNSLDESKVWKNLIQPAAKILNQPKP